MTKPLCTVAGPDQEDHIVVRPGGGQFKQDAYLFEDKVYVREYAVDQKAPDTWYEAGQDPRICW